MAKVRGAINLRGHAKSTVDAAILASQTAAEHVLGVAQQIVPLEEGTLERSGRVVVSAKGRRATITFDTPYAVVQHENLEYNHAPGRQAKYLSEPMLTEQEIVLQIMAAVLRRAFRNSS